MGLNAINFTNGLFSLITVSTAFIIGLTITRKYFQYRGKEFLYIGLGWMGIFQPWYPSAVVFVLSIFNITEGIDPRIYMLIGNIGIPVTGFLWFMGITELVYKNKRIFIVGSIVSFTIVADIIIGYFLLTDYGSLGKIVGILNAEYEIMMVIYLMIVNILVAISGILLGRESLHSENSIIQWRGKLIISASICYSVGAFLDSGAVSIFPELVLVTRLILILSSFLFYFGFLMPKFIENILS
jgi:hypothetical protein